MSNNLDLSQVAAAQNRKEVTINDQAGEIDAALTDDLEVLVDDTNAVTLTAAQFARRSSSSSPTTRRRRTAPSRSPCPPCSAACSR